MEEIPPQLDTELSHLLDKFLKANDINSALSVINDNKHSELLKENCADLIPLVTEYLSETIKNNNLDVFECCQTLLCIIAQKSRTQDVIFELMNIVDTCKEDFKLKQLFPAYRICWSQIPSNRSEIVQWSLNSIFVYIENIFDSKKDTEQNVDEQLLSLCEAVANFSTTLLEEENLKSSSFFAIDSKNYILVKFLVKLLGKPLGYIKVRGDILMQRFLTLVDKLLIVIKQLLGDIFLFMTHCECEISSDDYILECPVLSLGVLYYLTFVENIQYDGLSVYDPTYITRQIILLANPLLKNSGDLIIFKGIQLANVIFRLTHTINSNELGTTTYRTYFLSLSNIIIYNSSAKLRKLSLDTFTKTIKTFDSKGRYLLLSNLVPSISHAGLKGCCCVLYKDMLLEAFISDAKFSYYFRDKRLFYIINIFMTLPEGPESDLIDLADQIISALNMLRFLIIRDIQNVSGIKNYLCEIQQNLLKPLREGLKLSRAHYDMKLQKLYEEKQGTVNNSSDSNFEVSVGDYKLPDVPLENQIAAVRSMTNAFDIIESLVTYLEQNIEAKK